MERAIANMDLDTFKSRELERNLREDVSLTFREPYPSEYEIGLPRKKLI